MLIHIYKPAKHFNLLPQFEDIKRVPKFQVGSHSPDTLWGQIFFTHSLRIRLNRRQCNVSNSQLSFEDVDSAAIVYKKKIQPGATCAP